MAKTPLRRLTHAERAQIHALRYEAGWSYKQISEKLGIPYNTVRHCAQSRITPTKPKGGRRPLFDTPTKRRLIDHAIENRFQRRKPLLQIAQELGIQCQEKTLKKAFSDERYYRRVATKKPWLDDIHV